MTKEKACLSCKTIYEGEKCPACGETPSSNAFKGRVQIFNAEESIIAKGMKVNKNGEYAIKSK